MNSALQAILVIEIGLIVAAAALGIRSSMRLWRLYRASGSNDVLARVIGRYFGLVTLTALWFAGRIILRFLTRAIIPELWVVDAAFVFGVLAGPTYIEIEIRRAAKRLE